MNLNKRILFKLGIVLSLLVVNVIAATPGSECDISGWQRAGGFFISLPGRVSADGKLCVPTPPVNPNRQYAVLNKGLACGTFIDTFAFWARATCKY